MLVWLVVVVALLNRVVVALGCKEVVLLKLKALLKWVE